MDCCVLSLPVVLFVLCLLAPDKQRIYRVKFRVRFRSVCVIRNFVFWCQYFFETFLRERRVPANGGASPGTDAESRERSFRRRRAPPFMATLHHSLLAFS